MELVIRCGEREERVRIARQAGGYRVEVGGIEHIVDSIVLAPGLRSLLIDGRQVEVALRPDGEGYAVSTPTAEYSVEVADPLTHLARTGAGDRRSRGGGRISAYMPGRVVSMLVAEGQAVVAGQGLLVLEAMKMQNEIRAEKAGIVAKVHVVEGQAVEGGDALLDLA
jgi:biotin carboxyl carrier protein